MNVRTLHLLLIISLLGAAWLHAEDEIVPASGAKVTGWVVQCSPESALVVAPNFSARRVPLAGATLNLDFALPHCGIIQTARASQSVLIESFRNGVFSGKDSDGKAWSAALKDIGSLELYPTSRFARTLPVSHQSQKPDYCGEACVAMVAKYLGRSTTQDQVNGAGGLDGKRGVYSNELEKAVADLKLKSVPVAAAFPDRDADDALLDRWRLVLALERCRPVLMGVWANPKRKSEKFNFDHFVLLVGYDLAKGKMIIHDPGGEALWERTFEQFARHRQTKTNLVYQIEFPLQRTWTLRDGKKYDGAFAGMAEGKVRLESAGKFTLTPLASFIDADREFLEKLK